jgi:steroid delta-isomerase
MAKARLTTCLCLMVALVAAPATFADEAADKAAITERLRSFSDAFNARDDARICDIFAPDLIASIPLAPEATRPVVCENLNRVLSKQELQLHYDYPDIKEIIIAGDIAIVRLIWTLTVQSGDEKETTREGGIDIFRREPDGRWSIIRMAAVDFQPGKILN